MSGAIVMRIKALESRIDELFKDLEVLKNKVPKDQQPRRRGRPPKRDDDAGPREAT